MTDIVNIGFSVDTSQIKNGTNRLERMGKSAAGVESKVNKSTRSMTHSFGELKSSIGLVTTAMASFAAASEISQAINAIIRFEKSISSLSAITGAAGDDLEFYKQQAAEIGRTTTLSASQAADAFRLIASAKPDLLENAAALADVTKQAVILSEASAGTLSLEAAAEAIGKSLNQFSLDASKSVDVVNLLAEASRAGTAGVSLISESLKNVGATANGMNVSLTETVAGIEALAKAGIDGAEAGTALRQILSKLEKTGNKELQPSVVGLTTAIENLSKMQLSSLDIINMFGEEAQTAANAILSQKGTLDQLSKSLEGTNTAYRQASTNVDNLDGDLKSLNSVVESLQIAFGEDLNPAMRVTVQEITDVLKNSDALSDAIGAVALVIGASAVPSTIAWSRSIAAVIAQSLLAVPANASLTKSIFAYTGSATAAAVATNALAMASRFLLGPWGLLIAAIGTGISVYASSKKSSDELNKSLSNQKKEVDKLTASYNELTSAGKESVRFQLVAQLEDLRKKSIETRSQINKFKEDLVFQDPAGRAFLRKRISELQESLKSLDGQYANTLSRFEKLRDSDLASGWINPKDVKSGTEDVKQATNEQIESLKSLQAQLTMTNDELFIYQQKQESIKNGDSPEVTKQIVSQAKAYLEARDAQDALFGQDQVSKKAMDAARSYREWIDSIETTTTRIQDLNKEIEKTQDAAAKGLIPQKIANEHIGDLEKQVKSLKASGDGDDWFSGMAAGANQALNAMQNLFEAGSKESKQLVVAIQAVTTAMAVLKAINDTTTGNVLSAAVAGVGLIASADTLLNKEIKVDFEENQASQGLNQFGEKATSIAEATKLTSSATKQLVGINTDMLKALSGVNMAIGGAAGIVVNNTAAPQIDVSKLFNENLLKGINTSKIIGDNFISDVLDGIIGSIGGWLGGSSKVSDEGIRILGGTISNMINNTVVQAFQEVKYKKWRWGSTKRKTATTTISGQATAQISLVFDSIADAVSAGAKSLGFSQEYMNSILNNFVVSTKRISTKGMSPARQQKEIEAYFSQVFNSLSMASIPFLTRFQKAGEELGTTMSRLATQVSIADYITENFGVSFGNKMANPAAYAQASNNLANIAGGVESLSKKTSNFTEAFASRSEKVRIYGEALNKQLSAVGLELPKTAAGMFDLMSGLSGATARGQQQVATLLNVTDTAQEYYRMLGNGADEIDDRFKNSSESMRNAADSMFELSKQTKMVSLDAALASAQLGDFSIADSLNLGQLSPDKSDFSSLVDYNVARAETAVKLNKLADIQDGQVTVADEQLSVLKQIRDKITAPTTSETMDSAAEIRSLRAEFSSMQSETNSYLKRIAYS